MYKVDLHTHSIASPDGSLTSTTTFVFGDSYANPGQFSTRTLISRSADGSVVADLEQFTLLVDGRVNNAADRNIWGVTYIDDNTFYATAASGGVTWLVHGDVAARTLTSIRTDVKMKDLIGKGSGEQVQMAFSGQGWVLVQPSEGQIAAAGSSGGGGGGLGGLLGQ